MGRQNRRAFFASFFSTLCVIALVLGIAEVDANSRRIGFGDNKTVFTRYIGQNWQETCNTVKVWYNNFVSALAANDVEESK
ncbi:MAG: hypothetical protein GX424_04415 [Clostridiales bacterium]|jgi:hypothetical protein|nr:hypothetical protein [Clostridiales bacterium]